jgi:CheY-like chemotaxis protein
MRILYIEDEPLDSQLVERYVAITPHELVVVRTAEEARAALDVSPDLFLVDILLNKTRQGYDFISELRDAGYDQPIIAITGLALPPDIERCYEVGVTDILTKPYTVTQLADLLNRYAVAT